MENKVKITISQLPDMDAPMMLHDKIIMRIFSIRRREAYTRVAVLTGVFATSCALLWDTFAYALDEASSSGFIEYVRLLLTDGDIAISMWREIITTAINSAPIITIMLTCAVLVLFVTSLSALYKNARAAISTSTHPQLLIS